MQQTPSYIRANTVVTSQVQRRPQLQDKLVGFYPPAFTLLVHSVGSSAEKFAVEQNMEGVLVEGEGARTP